MIFFVIENFVDRLYLPEIPIESVLIKVEQTLHSPYGSMSCLVFEFPVVFEGPQTVLPLISY